MRKERYESPEAIIEVFESEDIIQTSGGLSANGLDNNVDWSSLGE